MVGVAREDAATESKSQSKARDAACPRVVRRGDIVNGNPWQPAGLPSIDPSFIEALQPHPAGLREATPENVTLSRWNRRGMNHNRGIPAPIIGRRRFGVRRELKTATTTFRTVRTAKVGRVVPFEGTNCSLHQPSLSLLPLASALTRN